MQCVCLIMGNCCSELHESLTHSKARKRLRAWGATGIVGLRDEQLKELPLTLRDIAAKLTSVDAGNNRLRSLPSFLGEFENLQRLIVPRNDLVALPDSLGQLKQLKVLILDFNKIATIPESLCRLVALEKLSIASNCLTVLPEGVGRLTKLKELDVADNRISDVRCTFSNLNGLESLKISNNEIKEVPSSLRFCVRLRDLHAERNRIQAVPSVIFLDCRSLQTLSLDGNPISMDDLEDTDGYQLFEERRKEKANKAISSQVMLGEETLNEAISRKTQPDRF